MAQLEKESLIIKDDFPSEISIWVKDKIGRKKFIFLFGLGMGNFIGNISGIIAANAINIGGSITGNFLTDLIEYSIKLIKDFNRNLSKREVTSLIIPSYAWQEIHPLREYYLSNFEKSLDLLEVLSFMFSTPEKFSTDKVYGGLVLCSTLIYSGDDKVAKKACETLYSANFDKYISKVNTYDEYVKHRAYLGALIEAEGKNDDIIRCRDFIYQQHTNRELEHHFNWEAEATRGYYQDPTGVKSILSTERKLESLLPRHRNSELISQVTLELLHKYLQDKDKHGVVVENAKKTTIFI